MPNRQTTRDNVPVGAIFALRKSNGSSGSKRYGAIGTNGKFASVNMETGKLAFTPTSKAGKQVSVVGSYNIDTVLWPLSVHRHVPRSEVADNQLFTVAKGSNIYAHLGKNNNGEVVSLNLRSRDYAVGIGRGKATIVGTYELKGS